MRAVVLALVLCGCSSFNSYGAGTAIVVGDRRREGAIAVETAKSTGSSTERGTTFDGVRLRGVIAEHHKSVAALGGFSRLAPCAARSRARRPKHSARARIGRILELTNTTPSRHSHPGALETAKTW